MKWWVCWVCVMFFNICLSLWFVRWWRREVWIFVLVLCWFWFFRMRMVLLWLLSIGSLVSVIWFMWNMLWGLMVCGVLLWNNLVFWWRVSLDLELCLIFGLRLILWVIFSIVWGFCIGWFNWVMIIGLVWVFGFVFVFLLNGCCLLCMIWWRVSLIFWRRYWLYGFRWWLVILVFRWRLSWCLSGRLIIWLWRFISRVEFFWWGMWFIDICWLMGLGWICWFRMFLILFGSFWLLWMIWWCLFFLSCILKNVSWLVGLLWIGFWKVFKIWCWFCRCWGFGLVNCWRKVGLVFWICLVCCLMLWFGVSGLMLLLSCRVISLMFRELSLVSIIVFVWYLMMVSFGWWIIVILSFILFWWVSWVLRFCMFGFSLE